MSNTENLLEEFRRYLDEEEFKPIIAEKSIELPKDVVSEFKRLWDEKSRTYGVGKVLDFYEFTSQRVENLTLQDLYMAPFREKTEFYFKNIAKHLSPTDNVLDIGCSNGLHDPFISQHVDQVVGIDISKGQLTRAKERVKDRNQNIDFILADMNNLPIREGYFDHVICLDTIREGDGMDFSYPIYDTSIQRRVSEFRRVLKNGKGMLTIGSMYKVPYFRSPQYDTLLEKSKELYEKLLKNGFNDGEFLYKALSPVRLENCVAFLYNLKAD